MIRSLLLAVAILSIVAGLATASEAPHWDYEGEEGPEYWGELSAEFDTCGKGANQSPIDLVADIGADLPELDFDYTKPGVE